MMIPIRHATVIYAHAVEYCASTIFSLICRPTPITYSAKYSLTRAVITLDGTDTLSAVNIYGTLLGSLSFRNTVRLFAAITDIRSSEYTGSSVSPLYALMLIFAIQTIMTTSILATMLLTLAFLLTSFVQFVITGASATIGIALNAATIESPPEPHTGNTAARIAIPYPINDPSTSPDIAAISVAPVFDIIFPMLSEMISA